MPQEERREKERASLTDVMEMATAFFQERLQGPEGAKARAYLRERGLTPATQQSFRLGYAPDSRNALKEHLAAKGVPKADIEACGLVRHGDDIPVSYDWFRDRIMFPIPDSQGQDHRLRRPGAGARCAGQIHEFAGHRALPQGQCALQFRPRPQGGWRKGGTVIAVEGYMDVIALAQAGFENVVAPLGTALTENQLELLWRMAGEPVLCFDGDQAGLKAAWRAADMALPAVQAGRSARFALLPEGKDPDDLVKAEGPDAFRAVLAEARPLADLLWMRETSGGVFDTPERRAELEKTLRELTSRIRDESLRYHYQQEMRERVLSFFGAQRGARQGVETDGPASASRARLRTGRTIRAWRECRRAHRDHRKPRPLGAGQARRRGNVGARGDDHRSPCQPSGADRREFRPCRISRPRQHRSEAIARSHSRRDGA